MPGAAMLRALKNTALYLLVRVLLAVLRPIPHPAAVALGGALGRLASRLPLREARRAAENLARIWPELPAERRRRLVSGVFSQLGSSALEWAVMRGIRKRMDGGDSAVIRFVPGALERLRSALEGGRGVVFATAHMGNWELMAAAVSRLAPVTVLFKPSYDPRLTRLMERFRQDHGVRGVDVTRQGHLVHILRALGKGEVVGVLVDQPVMGAPLMPFLGQPAPTSDLAEALARRCGASLVLGYTLRERPCQHAIFIEDIPLVDAAGKSRDAMGMINQRLGDLILKEPEQWAWTLDRWRWANRGATA